MSSSEPEDDEMDTFTSALDSPSWANGVALWLPRIIGAIYILCSTRMIWMAWNRKEHIFHRLILGMAINQFVFGIFLTVGPAAFPEDSAEYVGVDGSGNITTCTAQGFFLQLCFLSALCYYALFSVYSYVSVPNNFQVSKFDWIEKYIHVSAHIYPLAASIVSLATEGYNPNHFGFCVWNSRHPFLCEAPGSGNVPCERGSPETTLYLLAIIPETLILILPSVVMGALYLKVKRNQSNIRLQARSVASQASVYLLMLFWVTIPVMALEILVWKVEFNADLMMQVRIFMFIGFINAQCFGLFSLLVYRYFTTGEYHRKNAVIGDGDRRKTIMPAANAGDGDETAESMTPEEPYSFNIFDGTNAGGAFADFIYEGDEDDEAENDQETEHWKGLQGL